jgi:AcrR family transcriptional regulator
MTSYIAERRQEEKDRRRTEIVEAAEHLYRELGWDAVTIDRVAKQARLSRALVYVYFKDKSELHFAITTRAMAILRSRFEAASASHDAGIDKIMAIGAAYMAFARDFPHYFDACARLELHAPDATGASPFESRSFEAGEQVMRVVVDALELGRQDGSVRADLDPHLTARVLWGFTHGIMQIATTKHDPLARVGISVPALTEHATAMIRSMLAPPVSASSSAGRP